MQHGSPDHIMRAKRPPPQLEIERAIHWQDIAFACVWVTPPETRALRTCCGQAVTVPGVSISQERARRA
jgi:hypothetical protein